MERQRAIPVIYDEVKLECGFRADLIVNNAVIVEIKAKEAFHPVDDAQLLSYSALARYRGWLDDQLSRFEAGGRRPAPGQ